VQTTILDASTGVKKKRRVPLEAKTAPEARNEMGQVLMTLAENGTLHGAKGPTFGEYRAHYIKHAGKAQKTLSNENHFLSQWEKFLGPDTRITEITARNVLGYRTEAADRNLSNRSINLHVRALRQLLKMGIMEGYLKDLPTKGIKSLKEDQHEKTLYSKEQLFGIATEALRCHPRTGAQVADWIALAMYSGGRVGELLLLRWSNVDWNNRQLTFPAKSAKSREVRRVDFSKNLEAHLKAMKEKNKPDNEDAFLFPSFRTNNVVTSFKKTLWAIREKLGFKDFTPHSTRHHFTSECVMKKIDYLTIAKWLGHKDGGVLIGKIYGHLNNAHMKEQASKLDT
jgi:integrase